MTRSFALISGIQPEGGWRQRGRMEGKNGRKELRIDDHIGWFRESVRITCLERHVKFFLRRSVQSSDRVISQGYLNIYIYIHARHRACNKAWVRNRWAAHTSKMCSITEGWIEFSTLFLSIPRGIRIDRRFVESRKDEGTFVISIEFRSKIRSSELRMLQYWFVQGYDKSFHFRHVTIR